MTRRWRSVGPAALAVAVLGSVTGTVVAAGPGAASATPMSTWTLSYDGAVPSAARPAVQRAVDAWAAVLPSDQTIVVSVSWATVPAPGYPAAGAPADVVVHDPDIGVLYPLPLEEAFEHRDLNAGAADITLALDPAAPWSYDANAPSPSTYDLSTLAMRALGTGLGLGSGLNARPTSATAWSGSFGADSDGDGIGDGAYPPGYDAFVSSVQPYRAAVLDYDNRSAALGSALTAGRLLWSGPLAARAAGGTSPTLYAPSAWAAGSSASYLDEASYPAGTADSLMTPVIGLGEVVRAPGAIAPAMLLDLLRSPAAGAPVRHYVNALYQSFLFRDADPVGLPYWTQQLVSGTLSRLQLAVILSQSQEYLETVVRRLYAEVLGRPADPAGLAGWVRNLQQGTQIATVGASFYASDENYTLTGGTAGDPGPWVEGLYRSLLGRPSDPAGRASWVQQSRTKGRLFVTTAFYGSTETLVRRVNNLYLTLLDRDADPTGLQYWPGVVRDRGDLALAATLATSDEFYARAQQFPLPAP